MADSNGKGRDPEVPDRSNVPLQQPPYAARHAVPPPPHTSQGSALAPARRLEDLVRRIPSPGTDIGKEPEPESSFVFPPPSVRAPPSSSSISPVAIAAEDAVEERRNWQRPSRKAVALAAALTVAATVGVLGTYSALSARSSATFGLAWANGASPAVPVLGSAGDDWSPAPEPEVAKLIESLPAFAQAGNAVADAPPREASTQVKASADAALSEVLATASKRCAVPGMTPTPVRVTAKFNSQGSVSDATVDGLSARSASSICLAKEARKARIDRFDADGFSVTGLVTVPPAD